MAILVALSCVAICVYGYVAVSRMTYPFTIEWVESNTFVHVVRILEHKSIYVPPSFDFIPMIYTPGYYYLAALFAKMTGHIMFSMRLVSILASIQVFAMLYMLCRLQQMPQGLSFVAVGLFAASYAVTGFWFDVGRVDTLFLALLLTGYVLTFVQTKHEGVVGAIAGLVIFLSFATKQSALLAIPFVLLYLWSKQRYLKAFTLGLSFVGLMALVAVTMDVISNEWFWIYIYKIPAAHPISWKILTQDFWVLHIFSNFPWLILLMLVALVGLWISQDKKSLSDQIVFAVVFLLPLTMISISSMSKQWGYINGLLPIAAGLSVMSVVAYQQLALAAHGDASQPQIMKGLYYAASLMILLQFGALRYDFSAQIPSTASLDAGNKLLALIAESKRPILVPTSPDLLYRVHQPPHVHGASFEDFALARQFDPQLKQASEAYWSGLTQYIGSKAIQTAILPNVKCCDQFFNKAQGYYCADLAANMPRLIPMTGAKIYPDRICYFNGM